MGQKISAIEQLYNSVITSRAVLTISKHVVSVRSVQRNTDWRTYRCHTATLAVCTNSHTTS